MYNDRIKSKIGVELAQADKNRREGLEGRARVCARRAAGLAIREYFAQRGMPPAALNTLDLIQAFKDLPDVPQELRRSAEMLVLRVDEAHQLPGEIDLIAVAGALIDELERLDKNKK